VSDVLKQWKINVADCLKLCDMAN